MTTSCRTLTAQPLRPRLAVSDQRPGRARKEPDMSRALTRTAVILSAALYFCISPGAARASESGIATDLSAQAVKQKKQGSAAPARRAAPRAGRPRSAPPPRIVGPHPGPRIVGPRPRSAPRAVGPRSGPATPRVVGPRPGAGPRIVTPGRGAPPRAVTFSGPRVVHGSRLRGIPPRGPAATVIRGQNFSAWRNGYRVRHGNRWRTFVALGALGAIAVGTVTYYPYAYLSAPQPLCDGLTEDGCQMMWQDVETLDGDIAPQCVAYCPWQE